MARNKYGADCYECGYWVTPGTGHFEKAGRGWRVKHANVSGDGRVTCDMAKKNPPPRPYRSHPVKSRSRHGAGDWDSDPGYSDLTIGDFQ